MFVRFQTAINDKTLSFRSIIHITHLYSRGGVCAAVFKVLTKVSLLDFPSDFILIFTIGF